MFRQFIENRIYKKKNGYYCNLCDNFLQTIDVAMTHIYSKNTYHHTLKRAIFDESDNQFKTLSEKSLEKLVENYILKIQAYKYHCHVCNCEIKYMDNVFAHIKQTEHLLKMKNEHKRNEKAKRKREKLQILSEHNQMPTCSPFQKISKSIVYNCFLCDSTFPDHDTIFRHFMEPENNCSIWSFLKLDDSCNRVYRCVLCLIDIPKDTISLIQHTQGKKHRINAEKEREKLQQNDLEHDSMAPCNPNTTVEDTIATETLEPVQSIPLYNCFLCDSTFPNQETAVLHFVNSGNGCSISSLLGSKEIDTEFCCELCLENIPNDVVCLIQHTQGSKHERNAKKKRKSHLKVSESDTTRKCNSILECNPSTNCINAVGNRNSHKLAQKSIKLPVYDCFLCDSNFPDQDTIVRHFMEPENKCSISSFLRLDDPRKPSFRCYLCLIDIPKDTISLIQHTQGKKHRINAEKEREKLQQNDIIGTETLKPVQSISLYNCFLCDSTFSDKDTAVLHFLKSDRGCSISSFLKLNEFETEIVCKLCFKNIPNDFDCFIEHMHGRMHKKNAKQRRECNSTTKCVYTCFFCKSVFTDKDTIAEHFFKSGKCKASLYIRKHSIIDNKIIFTCDLCSTFLCQTFDDLLVHTQGKKHKNNVRERENLELNASSCSSMAESTSKEDCKSNSKYDKCRPVQHDSNSYTYFCLLCDRNIINIDVIVRHCIGPVSDCPASTFLKRSMVSNKELFSCILCHLCFFDKFELLQHIQGKVHKSNVAGSRKNLSFEASKQMPEHKENLKESILYKKVISERLMNISNVNYPYFCNICHKKPSSDQQLLKHLNGSQHTDLISKLPKGFKIFINCLACKVRIFGDKSIMNHLDSNEHKRKLCNHIANSDHSKRFVTFVSLNSGPNPEVGDQVSEMQNKPSRQSRKPRSDTSEDDANELNSNFEFDNLFKELCPERKRKIRRRNTDFKKKVESTPHFNEEYCRVFLESGSSNIFDIDQERIEQLKCGIALLFLLNDKRVCLACNQQMPNDLQLLYEHLFNVTHLRKLDQLIIDDLAFEQFRDQFSNLALAKEFMIEVNDDVLFCFACETKINNDDNIIRNHVENDDHKVKSEKQKELTQEICNTFVEQLNNAWYIVQRFWCQLCNMRFEYDTDFAEHLKGTKHTKMVQEMASKKIEIWNDVCIPCGCMSMGEPDTYTKHCDDKMHKYLVRTKDYAVPEMLIPAKNLLNNVEEIAESLVLESDAVTFLEEKFGLVLRHLEEAVKLHYPEAKAYAFGSRVSNLAFPDSDLDIFLDCGKNFDYLLLL